MQFQHEILSFDPLSGALLVRYFSTECPEGLVYNIDVPFEGGAYVDEAQIETLISLMSPAGQLERLETLRTADIPSHLAKFVPEVTAETVIADGRNKRNALLFESDWTQLPDTPLSDAQKVAWGVYRQALRDVPSQTGFPDSIEWPVAPV